MTEDEEHVKNLLFGLTGYWLTDFPNVANDTPPPHPLEDAEMLAKERMLDTDRYLGRYIADKKLIELFPSNIAIVADVIGCCPYELYTVVLIHEWAHAVVHLGLEKDDHRGFVWEQNNPAEVERYRSDLRSTYDSIEPELHEQIAQFLTYHALSRQHEVGDSGDSRKSAQLVGVFTNLMNCQSRSYQIDVKSSRDIGVTVLKLIKRRALTDQKIKSWYELLAIR